MTERTTGSLTAADLGKQARVEFEGWVHTGSLDFAHHENRSWSGPVTFLALQAESGSRWMKHLPADHPIEIRDEESA